MTSCAHYLFVLWLLNNIIFIISINSKNSLGSNGNQSKVVSIESQLLPYPFPPTHPWESVIFISTPILSAELLELNNSNISPTQQHHPLHSSKAISSYQ